MNKIIKWTFHHKYLLFFFLSLSLVHLHSIAQDRGVGLETLFSQLDDSRGIKINFVQAYSGLEKPFKGTYIAKQNCFHVSSELYEVWYNGENLWVLNRGTKEVNLSEPSPEELYDIILFANFDKLIKQNFNCKTRKGNNGQFLLEASPLSNYQGFIHLIRVRMNEKGIPLEMEVIEKGSQDSVQIRIESIQKPINIDSTAFVFNPSKYKGYTIIDLR